MKRIRPVLRRIVVFSSVAFAVLFIAIHLTPLVPWYARQLAGVWNDPEGDILIVLAAEKQPDNLIGPISYWRAVYAARAFHSGHFRTVVISGGAGDEGTETLATSIGHFLECYGVPASSIVLEQRSTSTRENALYTKALIGNWPGKKVLLTSDYHMYRAHRAFARAGLDVAPRPVPDLLKSAGHVEDRWNCFVRLAIETAKIVRYRWKQWI